MEKVMTWEDVAKAEIGHVFHDVTEDGMRFMILRGPSHLCAYLGISPKHPLAGYSYDDLAVDAHGGLTYAQLGDGKYLPADFFWYGWDYGHSGDYATYYDQYPKLGGTIGKDSKKWLPDDVINDSWGAQYDFKKLMHLAEQIYLKARIL